VDGDRVYVFNSYLKLFCLRADNGQEIWSRDFRAENPGTQVIFWQNAASPLIVGDLIYVNSNVTDKRLTAVNKSNGTTKWTGQNDQMTHATPAFATIAGTPQVIFLTAAGLVGMSPDSNTVLWRYPFNPSGTSAASTPVVAGDLVYATCNYGYGAWTAHITKSGDVFDATDQQYQRATSYQSHWATPVHHDGFLYTVLETSPKRLGCYDTAGRTNRWSIAKVGSGNIGFGSLIKVGNVLVVLTETGELVLVQPNPEAYTEIGRFKALTTYCWNHPSFANGRLYARSSSELIALDVAPAVVSMPPLRLDAALDVDGTKLVIIVTTTDGTPLPADAAARIVLESAEPVGGQVTQWNATGIELTGDATSLRAELPLLTSDQFLRLRVPSAP
jgi:outer membrane protein assembly factor BamB